MTAATYDVRPRIRAIPHPLLTLLLGGGLALFLGVLLSDIAYANSDQVQWKNFASWLNAGALLLSGAALLWSAVTLVGAGGRRGPLLSAGLLLVGWILGLVNLLVHAKDAAASLPEGLVLAVLVVALVGASTWLALDDRAEVRA